MNEKRRMLFLVKVRVNLSKMMEFGRMLQQGALDRSAVRMTYCLQDDPTVGVGIWDVADEREFKKKFAPWREYYESVEIKPVVTPAEAMVMLSRRRQRGSESR
jgi:hypothetical protein